MDQPLRLGSFGRRRGLSMICVRVRGLLRVVQGAADVQRERRGGSGRALATAIASISRERTVVSAPGAPPVSSTQKVSAATRAGTSASRTAWRRTRPRRRRRRRLGEANEQEDDRRLGAVGHAEVVLGDRREAPEVRQAGRLVGRSASSRRSRRIDDGVSHATRGSRTARDRARRTRWSSAPACIATAPSASWSGLGHDHDRRVGALAVHGAEAARGPCPSIASRRASMPLRRPASRSRSAARSTSSRSSSASSSAIAVGALRASPSARSVSSCGPPGRWQRIVRIQMIPVPGRRHTFRHRNATGVRVRGTDGHAGTLAPCRVRRTSAVAPGPGPRPHSPASLVGVTAVLSFMIGDGRRIRLRGVPASWRRRDRGDSAPPRSLDLRRRRTRRPAHASTTSATT